MEGTVWGSENVGVVVIGFVWARNWKGFDVVVVEVKVREIWGDIDVLAMVDVVPEDRVELVDRGDNVEEVDWLDKVAGVGAELSSISKMDSLKEEISEAFLLVLVRMEDLIGVP